MSTDPNLLQPQNEVNSTVPALAAITKPISNTKTDPVWFHCSMATASFHRQDGKKLPFLNHFFKATMVEDIAYLDKEVNDGNPYIRRATDEEVSGAKFKENPVETIREAVRAEVENSFSVEQLQALIEKRKKEGLAKVHSDEVKVAGVDKPQGSGFTGMTTLAIPAGGAKVSGK